MKRLERVKEVVTIDGVCCYGQAMSLLIDGEEVVFVALSKDSLDRVKQKIYPGVELVRERTSEVVLSGANRIVGKGSSI